MRKKMKYLNHIYKKLGALGLLFLLVISAMPGKSVAPTQIYSLVKLGSPYFEKINQTYWISYIVTGNQKRRIGITINPPYHVQSMTARKTIRPTLFGEVELSGEISCQKNITLRFQAWVILFNNTDAAFFLQVNNPSTLASPFTYQIAYEDEKSDTYKTGEIYPFRYLGTNLTLEDSEMSIEQSSSRKTKGEPFFFQTLRYDEVVHQFLKGPLFAYKNLPYGLKERIESVSSSQVSLQQDRIIIDNNCLLGEDIWLEDWIIFSTNQLLSIHSSVTKKILKTLDFYKLKRFSRDGFHYKCLNDGYLGENENTYYWDYSMYGARSILEYYYQADQTLMYDIAILSFLSLSRNRNACGWWSNKTVSTWLQSDYQIESSYFDTRFNVDAGIFLLEVYDHFQIPYALVMAEKIGNILLVMMQNGKAYPTENGGCLLQDYDVSFQSKIRCHASLNHVLNESSFFLLLYQTTRKEEYLFAQHQLILGITATEEQWKDHQSGDLFYCMYPDLSFGRKDYLTLTYHDLLRFNRLLQSITGLENSSIQRLGSFKEEFLMKLGIVKSKKFNLVKETQ